METTEGAVGIEVGFTGSRFTLPPLQQTWLWNLLCNTSISRLHHGDCVGADALVHQMCGSLGIPVLIHPPTDPRLRAMCDGPSVPAKPYLDRNRDIVDCSTLLIAAPDGPERTRSGTWSTVRYARSLNRSIAVAPFETA